MATKSKILSCLTDTALFGGVKGSSTSLNKAFASGLNKSLDALFETVANLSESLNNFATTKLELQIFLPDWRNGYDAGIMELTGNRRHSSGVGTSDQSPIWVVGLGIRYKMTTDDPTQPSEASILLKAPIIFGDA